MFPKSENISAESPIKTCNSNGTTVDFRNPGILSGLHSQALRIHPEWLNGFNVACTKSITIDQIIGHSSGVNSIGLKSAQFDFNYLSNFESNALHKMPITSNFFICYQPLASFRLKYKNQMSAPNSIFNETSFSSIATRNVLNADWFGGKSTRFSFSALFSDRKSISTSLSMLLRITSNFVCGAELNYNRSIGKTTIQPCLAAAYSNEHLKLVGTMWLNSSKIHLSYFRRINENVQAGSMFVFNLPAEDAIGAIFCQYNFGRSIIRAKIASNGLVGGTYDVKFRHFNITNSIVANMSTDKIIYGTKIGFEIWIIKTITISGKKKFQSIISEKKGI